ncbi:MAG: hypothetical protein AAB425_10470 [Bdellovibrionota bacterium]
MKTRTLKFHAAKSLAAILALLSPTAAFAADGDGGTGAATSSDHDALLLDIPDLEPGKLEKARPYILDIGVGAPHGTALGRAGRVEGNAQLNIDLVQDGSYGGRQGVWSMQFSPGARFLIDGNRGNTSNSLAVSRVEISNPNVFTAARYRNGEDSFGGDVRLLNLGFEYRDDTAVGEHQAVGTITPLMLSFHADGQWEGTRVHTDIGGSAKLLGIKLGQNQIADEDTVAAIEFIQGSAFVGTGVEKVGHLRLIGEGGVTSALGAAEWAENENEKDDYHDATSGFLRGGTMISDVAGTPLYVKAQIEHRGNFSRGNGPDVAQSATEATFTVGGSF